MSTKVMKAKAKTTNTKTTNTGGAPRKKTAVTDPVMVKVFGQLNELSNNPCGDNIIKVICGVVEADMKNLMPADIVSRTYKAMEQLNSMYENAIFGAGMAEMGSLHTKDEPMSLESNSGGVFSTGLKVIEGNLGNNDSERVLHGNETRKVNKETGS